MIGYSTPRASCGISSDITFSRLLRWVQECTKGHSKCVSAGKPLLPTRVLDVGTSDFDTIRVHETRHEMAPYACLSHCWGSVSFLKTETANLEAHTKGIPWSSLTKTFQDAILVTRRLQIRWLWIDALCIIQDDDLDWTRESASMASIYGNAYVTISATASKDGNGGLFSPEMNCKLIRYSKDGNQHCVHVRAHESSYWYESAGYGIGTFGFESSHWYSDNPSSPDKFPLLYRAWCYQERMLSSRILHFGRHEVLWECRTVVDCECGGFRQNQNLKLKFGESLESGEGLAWREIVTAYTRLALTRLSDRLPAISGVAKTMPLESTDYLAGIWKPHLPQDLLWQIVPGDPPPKAISWRAPSWSWAAVDVAVRYRIVPTSTDRSYKTWHTTVLKATCTPKGSDPTGQVISGSLIVRGPLVTADLSIEQSAQSPRRCHIQPSTNSGFDIRPVHWKHTFYADYQLPREEEALAASSALRIYCLGIATFREVFHDAYDPYEEYFYTLYLALRCIDTASQKYERIGLGQQEILFSRKTYIHKWVKQMQQETLRHPSIGNLFAEEYGEKVITIV
jgi:Heterokaryon incompatibility protein (HET)